MLLPLILAWQVAQTPHTQPLSRLVVAVEEESSLLDTPEQSFSGVIDPEVAFDRVLPAWNAKRGTGKMRLEVRVQSDGTRTGWISLTSGNQTGPFGKYFDSELRLLVPGRRLEYRATFRPNPSSPRRLTLLTFNFANRRFFGPSPAPKRSVAWGRVLPTPTKSAAPLDAILDHFRGLLPSAPEPVQGAWLAKFAAASAQGMVVAYPTRLTSISDLEPWIAWEIPVLCWLNDGTVRALWGFSKSGDPILLGTKSPNRLETFPRARFEAAWLGTQRRVAFVYPAVIYTPADVRSIWMMGHHKHAPNHLAPPGG
jgi:hypothetical protein